MLVLPILFQPITTKKSYIVEIFLANLNKTTQKINKYVKNVKCGMVVGKSSTIFILEIYILLPCKHFPETKFLTSYSTLNCSFGNL